MGYPEAINPRPPRLIETPNASEVAQLLRAAAENDNTVVITVGIPLSSDGANISFGSGVYDPIDDKRLLSLPDGLSKATDSDLQYALKLLGELRSLPSCDKGRIIFTLSVFNSKMVHDLGPAMARDIQQRIINQPQRYLPPTVLSLYRELNGQLEFDFSLDYRKLGARFVDRIRRAIRPPVPSVPSDRLIRMFLRTGATLVKVLDTEEQRGSRGRILCATPNTIPRKMRADQADPLDGRGDIRSYLAAIPLTNEYGSYICEVTTIGRLLVMISHASRLATANQGLTTLSIVNVCDPGNHKIHRMSWSAGEMVSALLPYISESQRYRTISQTHMTIVSNENHSIMFDSEQDQYDRIAFLDRVRAKMRRASKDGRQENILAGSLEGIRASVQNLESENRPVVFLYGPGDAIRA